MKIRVRYGTWVHWSRTRIMQILSVHRELELLLKSRWWNKFSPYFLSLSLCYIPIDLVVQFFLCFSLIKNTSRIMDTKVPAGAITSINGMRVMSMWWVILGHVYAFQLGSSISKYYYFLSLSNILIIKFPNLVDSVMCLSLNWPA